MSNEDPDRTVDHTPSPAGETPQPEEELAPGHRLEQYVIHHCLGRGAMGAVYLAEDTTLKRYVAIKVPFRHKYKASAEADRCIEEAQTVASLEHPAIVRVYAVGVDEAGWPFMVMEYLKGGSLAERLKHGPLPPRNAARILAVVADAVEFAHRNSFIHRDLKPGNILFDEAGKPRVADFGLAIRESAQGSQAKQTPGTPAYMSPEQLRGESAQDDARIDVWALGVMLYETLTGQRPFRTPSDILDTKPKSPRDVDDSIPIELQRICLKCLARNIEDRYQSTRELATALHRFQKPNRRTLLLALVIAAFIPALLAIPRLLHDSPVVEPEPVEPLHVNVEMGPPGNTAASQDLALYTGEHYVLRIDVNQKARLAIVQFACNEDGTRYELFDILSDENDDGTGVHSQAVSPEKPFSATFQTTPPPGTEAVFVLVAAHEDQLQEKYETLRNKLSSLEFMNIGLPKHVLQELSQRGRSTKMDPDTSAEGKIERLKNIPLSENDRLLFVWNVPADVEEDTGLPGLD